MNSLRYIAVGVGYIPAEFIANPPNGWNVRTAPPSFLTSRKLPDGALTLSLVRDDLAFPVIIVEDPGMEPELAYSDDGRIERGRDALRQFSATHAVVRLLIQSIEEKGRMD